MDYYLYLNVLMPLPLSQPVYTYRLEVEDLEVPQLVGKLVTVPFGPKKSYTGVVLGQSREAPEPGRRLKEVIKVLPYPPIPSAILELWQWAAQYYMCSLGDILVAAVQIGFRPDGTQEERTTKAALTLKGWLPSKKFISEERFQAHLLSSQRGSSAVTRALHFILTHYKEGDRAPMSIKEIGEWLEVSASVVGKLRKIGALEERELLATEVREDALLPTKRAGDTLSPLVRVGGNNILLLHAPGSHTEARIPIDYLQRVLTKGGQALLLLPDIVALKAVLPKLKLYFGDRLFAYSSSSSEKERRSSWLSALQGESGLYIGLRAAVWLPLAQLKTLVVVDEEDIGYRQFEPAPRFTATHVALMLAHFTHTQTLLISSTPSVESYTQALQKSYSFVEAPNSSREIRLQTVWMSKAFEENRVQARMLSFELMGAIREAIEEQGLALLLYQRKGFARRATCPKCEAVPKCPQCHTTLRYMEQSKMLVCGVCGHYRPLPTHCPECGASGMQLEGTGIERLRRAMEELYPGIVIKLEEEIDRRSCLPQIVLSSRFEPPLALLQEATTVGIVQLDLLGTLPDYRANEHTYRFLTKCRDEALKLQRMVIQHFAEEPNALTAFVRGNYQEMLDHELEERHLVQFPPFSRHIDVYFESAAQAEAFALAGRAIELLRQVLPQATIFGPAPMPLHKKQTSVGYKVTLFVPLTLSSSSVRQLLHATLDPLLAEYRGPKMYMYYDVDPL